MPKHTSPAWFWPPPGIGWLNIDPYMPDPLPVTFPAFGWKSKELWHFGSSPVGLGKRGSVLSTFLQGLAPETLNLEGAQSSSFPITWIPTNASPSRYFLSSFTLRLLI